MAQLERRERTNHEFPYVQELYGAASFIYALPFDAQFQAEF